MGPPVRTGSCGTARVRGYRVPSSDECGRPRAGRSHARLSRPVWPWFVAPFAALEPEGFVDEDDGDAAGRVLTVDDEHLVYAAVHAIRRLGAGVLEREDVVVDPVMSLLEVGHDLLRPYDEDDAAGAAGVWP